MTTYGTITDSSGRHLAISESAIPGQVVLELADSGGVVTSLRLSADQAAELRKALTRYLESTQVQQEIRPPRYCGVMGHDLECVECGEKLCGRPEGYCGFVELVKRERNRGRT